MFRPNELDMFSVYIDPERSDWKNLLKDFFFWIYENKEGYETEREFELLIRVWMAEEHIKERIYQSNSSVKIVHAEHCSKKVIKALS